MLDTLKTELILDWRQWVNHFDNFVGNNQLFDAALPHDVYAGICKIEHIFPF